MADSPPGRNRAFISYSHKDAKHLERLHVHLAPYTHKQKVDVWDDTRITLGARWKDEIEQAIASAKVAILLVSADFLASEFIEHDELPPLLEAAEQEGLRIFQVILSPCAFKRSKLYHYQALNSPAEPLIDMPTGQQEAIWTKLAEHVADALASASAAQMPVLAPIETPEIAQLRYCLSGLTREDLRSLLTLLKIGQEKPEDNDATDSKRARDVTDSKGWLLEEVLRVAKKEEGDRMKKIRRFAEIFELAGVLECLSDKH